MISLTTLLSRIIGLLRDRTFAHYYSTSAVMDSYYAAFRIPDLIFNLLIAGALTAGFIPVFTRLFYQSDDKSEAWKLVNNILNIVSAILSALIFFGIVFAPILVRIVAPGFSGEQLDLVTRFTRIMLFSPLLLGISMVLGGVLQSLRQFVLYSAAPVFYNLGIIIGAIFITKWFGNDGLAIGVVLGALFHLIIVSFGARRNNFKWKWYVDLKDKNTRMIGKLMIPRTMGLAMTQINTVIITALASLLPLGSVTIFNYANNLQAVPAGLIGIPFALAVFPVLSQKAFKNDKKEFSDQISTTARQVLFLIVPLSVILLLLRAQIVRVILGSGQFNWSDTIHTANALAFFSLGIFAQCVIPLLARSFYALNNTKTPFLIGIISEIISIVSALLLMRPLGVSGLALASSIGAFSNLIMLGFWLHKEVGNIFDYQFFILLFKISIAGIFMGVFVQIAKYPLANVFDLNYFWGVLNQGLFAGILGLLIYGLVCWVLRVEEMFLFQSSLRRKWLRPWRIREGIDEAEKLS